MQSIVDPPGGSGAARAAAAIVPGPADREHFFAAQARNRRAAWRLTALVALAVALMGVPMSAVISPLVYAALFVLNDLVSLAFPTAACCTSWGTPTSLRARTLSPPLPSPPSRWRPWCSLSRW